MTNFLRYIAFFLAFLPISFQSAQEEPSVINNFVIDFGKKYNGKEKEPAWAYETLKNDPHYFYWTENNIDKFK